MRPTTRGAAAAALALAALAACSRPVSDWRGTWSGVMTGSAVFPGCTSGIGERPITLALNQDGDRVRGRVTLLTGGPSGSCTFSDQAGQPTRFDWKVLTDEIAWLTGEPGAENEIGGTVSGKTLDIGGLRFRQTSATQASARLDMSRFDAAGDFMIRIKRGRAALPSP